MSDQDLRHLLGRALAGEPPLQLDRDEVFRRGRRRVRNRRFAEAGAVVVAVVAIVVGATSLTGLFGTGPDGELPAAATATTGTVATSGRPTLPGTSSPVSTTANPPPVPPAQSGRHAARLSDVLARANLLPNGLEVRHVPDERGGPLAFYVSQGGYKATADLKDARGEGNLFIEVDYLPPNGPTLECPKDSGQSDTSCSVVTESGVRMTVSTQTLPTGQIHYLVQSFRNDGTSVVAMTSNVSARHEQSGAQTPTITRDKPPVDHAVLKAIAALPGLTFA